MTTSTNAPAPVSLTVYLPIRRAAGFATSLTKRMADELGVDPNVISYSVVPTADPDRCTAAWTSATAGVSNELLSKVIAQARIDGAAKREARAAKRAADRENAELYAKTQV